MDGFSLVELWYVPRSVLVVEEQQFWSRFETLSIHAYLTVYCMVQKIAVQKISNFLNFDDSLTLPVITDRIRLIRLNKIVHEF